MLLIKTYTDTKYNTAQHAVYVIHHNNIKSQYVNLSNDALNIVLSQYKSIKLKLHVNVKQKRDLKLKEF